MRNKRTKKPNSRDLGDAPQNFSAGIHLGGQVAKVDRILFNTGNILLQGCGNRDDIGQERAECVAERGGFIARRIFSNPCPLLMR